MPDRIYNVQTNDPQELNMVLAQLTDHISKIDGTVSEAIEDIKKEFTATLITDNQPEPSFTEKQQQ